MVADWLVLIGESGIVYVSIVQDHSNAPVEDQLIQDIISILQIGPPISKDTDSLIISKVRQNSVLITLGRIVDDAFEYTILKPGFQNLGCES